MANIHIVIGTVTGTAAEVGEAACAVLQAQGHTCRLNLQYQEGDWHADEILLICTSNTGMGDLPADIEPLFDHLTLRPPNIVGWRYGVINLGDSSYPNFAEAGQTLDDALTDIGAQRIGEPLVLDALLVTDHPAEARDWLQQWGKLV